MSLRDTLKRARLVADGGRLWHDVHDHEGAPMVGKLLVIVSACSIAGVNLARAETWRAGVELIDQWSVFTCSVSVSDRHWDFTFEGSQVSASGPEGAKWTTPVGHGGSFKAIFTAYWHGRLFDGEVTGNAEGKWAIMHNRTSMCWYRLEPTAVARVEPAQTPSEWTSVAEMSDGACSGGALARVKEESGSIRLILVDGSTQFAQFDVALAADGSGQAEFDGATGARTRIEIPAGLGKRTMRSARLDGSCQWVWPPI